MPQVPLKVVVVCSRYQNRSVEAHHILSKHAFNVQSFATRAHVRIPGRVFGKPNVHDFHTTYDEMYKALMRKDQKFYTQSGILNMLDRNKGIKPKPQRFQNCNDVFDPILTCEERVYDKVVEDMNSREQETCQAAHVTNMDSQDNYEEAALRAFLISDLCQSIQLTEDMGNEIQRVSAAGGV